MNFKEQIRLKAIHGLTPEALSAFQFYEGDTNNNFLLEKLFDEETRKASKAYITKNTLMETNTAENQRFREGKKQLSKIITPEGIEKLNFIKIL